MKIDYYEWETLLNTILHDNFVDEIIKSRELEIRNLIIENKGHVLLTIDSIVRFKLCYDENKKKYFTTYSLPENY